jgi:uncharacterized protein (TIGR00251 family)
MSNAWCSEVPGGIRLAVQIVPNAKKNEIIGLQADALKIRLHAQPVEGKANDALIRYMADLLSIPRSVVSITHGQTNKRKIIEIHAANLTVDAVRSVFLPTENSSKN